MKSVVEFLWGSPIITEKSDEDWLIFVDQKPTTYIKANPHLAGPRLKPIDSNIEPINTMPEFLFRAPFYHCFCLYAQEFYIDEGALKPIKQIIILKEDICRMNLPNFYREISMQAQQYFEGLTKYCHYKKMSKIVKDCVIATQVAQGASFEEAIHLGNQISAPIKNQELTHEQSLELLKEYKNQIERTEVVKYFQQEINYTTYEKLKTLVDSIDVSKLTGIPVKGPF